MNLVHGLVGGGQKRQPGGLPLVWDCFLVFLARVCGSTSEGEESMGVDPVLHKLSNADKMEIH